VTDLCKLLQRAEIVFGIANTLDVEGFGLVINGGLESFDIIRFHELDTNAELLEGN
jgi:hypothetical protein